MSQPCRSNLDIRRKLIKRAVGETEKNIGTWEKNLKPGVVKVWKFKDHEACNKRVCVGISIDS